jgi:protease-4
VCNPVFSTLFHHKIIQLGLICLSLSLWEQNTLFAQQSPAQVDPTQVATTTPKTSTFMRLDDDISSQSGAQMLFSNPAGIGFNQRFQLAYDFWGQKIAQTQSAKHALGMTFSPFKNYHLGLGWQNGAFTFASALRAQNLSIGFSYQSRSDFWTSTQQDLAEIWKIGFQYRIARYLSLGLTEWLSHQKGQDLKLLMEVGLAIKPLTDRIILASAFRTDEQSAKVISSLQMRLGTGDQWFGNLSLYARHQYDLKSEDQWLALGLSFGGQYAVSGSMQNQIDDAFSSHSPVYHGSVRIKSSTTLEEKDKTRPKIVEISLSKLSEMQKSNSLIALSDNFQSPFLSKLLAMKAIEKDPSVSAVLLTFAGDNYDWGRAWEISQQIKKIKHAGKKVYAYLLGGSTQSYYVASHADEIWMAPVAELMLTSLGGQWLYFGDFLQRFGIKPQFLAVGEYKSAPEIFSKNAPSDASKEVSQSLLDQRYDLLIDALAQNRKFPNQDVKTLLAEGPFVAKTAKEKKLIDQIAFYDEMLRELEKKHPRHQFIQNQYPFKNQSEIWGKKDQVAVIYAVGDLSSGSANPLTGQSKFFNPETLVPLIEKLRMNDQVKAVVLRIDSPGGDVNGADVIWRYLSLLAKRKPLIVSMGDVAASGGYYVAAPAKKIFASPLTVTGSIGIFAGKPVVGDLLRQLGIGIFTLQKDENATTMSLFTPWSATLEKQFLKALTELYDLFLTRVLTGRKNLTREKLAKVASGRVWTGQDALKHGLVDQIGGLSDAIESAIQMTGAKELEVKAYYGESQSSLKKMILGSVDTIDSWSSDSDHSLSDHSLHLDDLAQTSAQTSAQTALPQFVQQLMMILSPATIEVITAVLSSLMTHQEFKAMAILPWVEMSQPSLQ